MSLSNPARTSFNVAGYRMFINRRAGIYPYFTAEARARLHKKRAVNIVITGEAGVSKTYTGAFMSKLLNPRWDVHTDLVMNFDEYMTEIMRKGKSYVPLCFDEPQDAIYNRDWQKEVNKALVKTMTSQRFRLRPILIPIINQSLLDVNIRKYLLQFHVVMTDPGEGLAYKLSASQTEDKLYRKFICRLKYGIMDINQCQKESCLNCPRLNKRDPSGLYACQVWRAVYERRKLDEINKRDAKSIEDQKTKQLKAFSNKELLLGCNPENFRNESGKYDAICAITEVEEKLGFTIGTDRAYTLIRIQKANDAKRAGKQTKESADK